MRLHKCTLEQSNAASIVCFDNLDRGKFDRKRSLFGETAGYLQFTINSWNISLFSQQFS